MTKLTNVIAIIIVLFNIIENTLAIENTFSRSKLVKHLLRILLYRELFGEGIVITLLRVDLVDGGGKKYRADGNSNEHYANGKFYRYAAAAL